MYAVYIPTFSAVGETNRIEMNELQWISRAGGALRSASNACESAPSDTIYRQKLRAAACPASHTDCRPRCAAKSLKPQEYGQISVDGCLQILLGLSRVDTNVIPVHWCSKKGQPVLNVDLRFRWHRPVGPRLLRNGQHHPASSWTFSPRKGCGRKVLESAS